MDLPTTSVVTFLSPISPPAKIPSNPASPDETPASPLQPTNNPTTTVSDVASPHSTGLQFSISLRENNQPKLTDGLPPFSSFLSDVRLLLSRPNCLKLQPDQSVLGRQHRREYYTNHTRKTKRPRFDQKLQYSLKQEFSTWEIMFWDNRRQEYTIQSTSLPSSASTLPCTDDARLRRSTPVGAVGPSRAKTNTSANADFQPLLNTQEVPSTAVQNLASRIGKLEKLFADEITTYTSITAGIHSQYFFLYDKIRQLEPGNSDAIIWKIPSVKFVFDSAKKARPSSDPLIEPATTFSSPLFRTHPHGYNFFINFYPYGIGPATGKCASILFTLFPGDFDNLLKWPFSKLIHIGIRDQLDPMNTWMKTIRPDQDPAYKKPTMSTKTEAAIVLINNFIPHSKLFSETEGFLIDGASFLEIKFFDPPVRKPQTNLTPLPFSIETPYHFHFPLSGVSYRVTHNA